MVNATGFFFNAEAIQIPTVSTSKTQLNITALGEFNSLLRKGNFVLVPGVYDDPFHRQTITVGNMFSLNTVTH